MNENNLRRRAVGGPEFANRGVSIWERDVFAFLDPYMLK
jgi:hypothetical protein